MTGHMCPECGGEQRARPEAGAGPGCVCGGRADRPAGEEYRAARSAETAAAEDFDPLRIRPYVTLAGDDAPDHPLPDAATTMPLFLGAPAPGGDKAAGGGGATDARDPSAGPAAVDETRRLTAAVYAGTGPDPVRPRRRRPFAAVAVGAAVAVVVGTAAFAGGLFGDGDQEDEALPELTSSIPDASDGPAPSASGAPSAPPSPTAPPSASASVSASASASPSPSGSPSASPSAGTSGTPSPPPSATASASELAVTATPTPPAPEAGTTLRRGDSGPEVAELQRRMQEIWVYRGPADAEYSGRVEDAVADFQQWVSVRSDPPGVYGPETRRALEARTTGTGRRS
ncbi:peptidoglycan-binding domain-containing protein [Streptomyces griseus]|uniref:peptidoglycan-binding domain-containing protein n=1 Tax=Streptomyces griseus TaxID=1911 RepID=UPI00084057A8|nr:peptidoglycan-binding domain-containing protein [Streptomyces griseus]